MMSKKGQFAAALLALAMMPMTMTACGGVECGANTTANDDGQCVPDYDAVTCADGTILSEGECVLDVSGCGANTTLSADGVCVPSETVCTGKTTFNTATGACEAAEECGSGTEVNADGECVPAAGACASGTTLNADGLCEVASAACGDGTTLDAATGVCALGDMVCGENTVLANGSCTIIADACEAGTTFNEGTGTCTPEAVCKAGDVILEGFCVTPAEAAIAGADVTIPAGNTNPGAGGTPVDVTIPALGTELVIAGTIEAPFDHDTDPDTPNIQDVDVVRFTSPGNQLIRFTVQPAPGATPMIAVLARADGEGGLRQTSAYEFGGARYTFLAEAGDYVIQVLPKSVAQLGTPVGSDLDDYALTIEEVALPTPANAGAGFSGNLTDLTDNFFALDQFTRADNVAVNFDQLGSGVTRDVIVHYLSGDGAGNYTHALTATVDTDADTPSAFAPLPSDDTAVLIEYDLLEGRDDSFTASLGAPAGLVALGALPDDTRTPSGPVVIDGAPGYFSFSVNAGQVVEVQFEDSGADAFVTVYGPEGTLVSNLEIAGEGSTGISCDSTEPCAVYFYSPNGGNYLVQADQEGTIDIDGEWYFRTMTPGGPEAIAIGETVTVTSTNEIDEGTREYTRFDVAANALLTIDAINANDGETDLFIFDAATGEELLALDDFVDNQYEDDALGIEFPVTAGSYLIGVGAEWGGDLDNGYDLVVSALDPPNFEVEPNDDAATATPLTLDTTYGLGETTAGDDDFFSFTVPADLAAGEFFALSVAPQQAFDTTVTFTYRVSGPGGLLAEQVGVPTDGQLWLPGLLSAETYTLEISTTSATPVDYRIEGEVLTGELESEPNDDIASANDLGIAPLPAAPFSTFYGAVSTDGVNGDADVFQVRLNAALDPGQSLVTQLEPFRNLDGDGEVMVEVLDSTGTSLGGGMGTRALVGIPLLAQGLYFVRVTRTDTDTLVTGRYALSVNVQNVVTDTEPNDDITTAAVLTSPTRLVGQAGTCKPATSLTCGGLPAGDPRLDQDYFTFTPTTTGDYSFQGTFGEANPNDGNLATCPTLYVFDTVPTVDSSGNYDNEIFEDRKGVEPDRVLDATVTLTGGTQYYIIMGGWCAATDNYYTYDVSLTGP